MPINKIGGLRGEDGEENPDTDWVGWGPSVLNIKIASGLPDRRSPLVEGRRIDV